MNKLLLYSGVVHYAFLDDMMHGRGGNHHKVTNPKQKVFFLSDFHYPLSVIRLEG